MVIIISTSTIMIMITTYRMSLRHVWVWWGVRAWRRRTSPGGRGTSPGSPSSSSSSSSSPPSSSSSSLALAVSMLPDPKSHLTEVKLDIEVFLQTNKQTNNDAKYVFCRPSSKMRGPSLSFLTIIFYEYLLFQLAYDQHMRQMCLNWRMEGVCLYSFRRENVK